LSHSVYKQVTIGCTLPLKTFVMLTNYKNLHLIVSAIFVTIISLSYGLFPNTILPKLFDFKVESIDLKHVFRATMGLYLGMVILWAMGVFKPTFWRTATISNIFFMSGLASGRIISLLADGVPSISFSVGLVLELTAAFWGIRNLNKYRRILNELDSMQ
jgi:Domain of unknown function (DUF4345)